MISRIRVLLFSFLIGVVFTVPLSSYAANALEQWKLNQQPPLAAAPASTSTTAPVASTPAETQQQVAASNTYAAAPSTNYGTWAPANTESAAVATQNTFSTESSTHRSMAKNGSRPLTYEQGQEIMLNSVPKPKMPVTPEASSAFSSMLQQNMPLSPQQVVQLHQQIDLAQRAAAVPANIPPKPVSTTLMINLAPGTTPPAVRLAQGYVSSLVFVDSTGSPWPIASFDVGNPKAVNIQWDGKSNILLLQAVSPYSNGDIVLRLVGLPTPVTLELVAGQRVVDYRVDIHVSGIGPNTKDLPMGSTLPASANQILLGVLDGIAPAGSKLLTVKGADCQAWELGENLYLRTRLTVLSPGWMGKMVSPDGMAAYELPKTSSVLVSRFGEPVELKIEGF